MYLVTETSNTRYEAYAEMCVCVCVSVCVMCTCVPTDLRGVRLLTEYQRQVRQVISGWHPSKNKKVMNTGRRTRKHLLRIFSDLEELGTNQHPTYIDSS